ncbi:ABC transporter ATP-binding protein [Ktedonosporobacter rubrisoli]|nr:ABC transporter ATP-binding protein [Ktedonosporobacter rubrisoli]
MKAGPAMKLSPLERGKRLLQHLATFSQAWKRTLTLIWHTHPGLVIAILALTILSGLLPSAQIQLTSLVIQSAAQAIQHSHAQALINLAITFGVLQGLLMLLSSLLGTFQEQCQSLLTLRLNNKISILIMEKAISLDLQHYEDDKLYDKLERAKSESNYRPYQIFSYMVQLCGQVVTLVSVVSVLVSWNWMLGLLILLAPLPSVGARLFYGQRGYQIERERAPQRRLLWYLEFLATHSYTVKEVRLFQLGKHFMQRYKQLYDAFYKVDSDLAKRQSLMQMPFALLTNMASAGAQIYAIVITIAGNQIGALAGYMQAIAVVQSSVGGLLNSIAELYTSNLFVSNLFEFLDVAPGTIKSGTRKMPKRLQKGIEFRNVSFVYPGTETTILHNLNLFLRVGECVALVGHNGAGKTTLVKLLSRLYEPSEGQILLDDYPIEEYDLDDLRKHISIIFQDFVRYNLSVRENIGFGRVEELENKESIRDAAVASGIGTVVEEFPQQYETMLGRMFEKGQDLSGGQWQKIALARAFMRHAPIVVLDEPTASMDAKAEAEIFARMQSVATGATTLLIAHRFSTVRMADRIIVIDQGKIIEDGTHEELIKQEGTYAQLFSLQAAGYLN